MAKSGHSSAVQTSSARVAASRLRCHETNTPGMATGAGVIPMRASPTITYSWILASLTGLLAFVCFGFTASRAEGEVRPPTAVLLSLDRPIDASAAPFVLASSRGLFGSEGLAVTTNIASGWADAIERVARGDSDFAVVDINVLIRFRDKSGAPPVKAVFVLFNKAPYAII